MLPQRENTFPDQIIDGGALRGETEISAQLYAAQVADEARQNPLCGTPLRTARRRNRWKLAGARAPWTVETPPSNGGGSYPAPETPDRDCDLSRASQPWSVACFVVRDGASRLGEVNVARSLRPALDGPVVKNPTK